MFAKTPKILLLDEATSALDKKNEKVFIDRDPKAFKMMIDFIRNNGKLYEDQEKNYKMLQIELEFWGIDERLFK